MKDDELADSIERMITTRMSANVIADLLKQGFSIREMADAIRTSVDFIHRVQRKLHSLSLRDLKRLAKLADTTPELLLFNAIRPVRADVKPLFDATRQTLEASAAFRESLASTGRRRKRRTSTKAA